MFYRGIPQIFVQNILWNFEGPHLVLLDAESHLHVAESLLGGERFSHVCSECEPVVDYISRVTSDLIGRANGTEEHPHNLDE